VSGIFKVAIIGSGPAGLSAAARAAALGLDHVLLEKTDHLSDTIYKYQKGKHVMATPSNLVLRSDIDFEAGKREAILGLWDEQISGHKVNVKYHAEAKAIRGSGDPIPGSVQQIVTRGRDGTKSVKELQRHAGPYAIALTNGEVVMAENVVLAIGTQGNPNLMRCPGADLPHVQYQLDDPTEYVDEHIVIVGTGDAGIENARGLAEDPAQRNTVSILNRGTEFPTAKDANVKALLADHEAGKLTIRNETETKAIEPGFITLTTRDGEIRIPCDRITRFAPSGRAQRQTHVEPGHIVGQQQVAFGLIGVEHVLSGQLLEIGGNQPLRGPRFTAHPHRGEAAEHHPEIGDAVRKVLLGDFDRGEIALTAQHRIGLGADVAQHRHRQFTTNVIGIGALKREARHTLEAREGGTFHDKTDVGIFGSVQRAGRTLEIAVYGKRGGTLTLALGGRDQVGAAGRGDRRGLREQGCRQHRDRQRKRTARRAPMHVGPPELSLQQSPPPPPLPTGAAALHDEAHTNRDFPTANAAPDARHAPEPRCATPCGLRNYSGTPQRQARKVPDRAGSADCRLCTKPQPFAPALAEPARLTWLQRASPWPKRPIAPRAQPAAFPDAPHRDRPA
jgi:thioredoxin reductase